MSMSDRYQVIGFFVYLGVCITAGAITWWISGSDIFGSAVAIIIAIGGIVPVSRYG